MLLRVQSNMLAFNANVRCSIFIFDTYPGKKARKAVALSLTCDKEKCVGQN